MKPTLGERLKAVQLTAVDLYDWLIPFVIVNLIWFALSLTLILMPPATAAIYELSLLAHRGQSPTPQNFWVAFKRWLVKSWIWGVGNAVFFYVLINTLYFYRAQETGIGDFLMAFTAVLMVFALLGQFYFWPYMVIQEDPRIRQALRNSIFTALGDPLLIIINGGITLILLVPGILIVAPMLLILPVFISLLGTYSLLQWLHQRGLLAGQPREL